MFYDSDDRRYLYIVTRRDLSLEQQAVQGLHAALDKRTDATGKHPSICFVTVKNEKALMSLAIECGFYGIQGNNFYENYGEHKQELTAIAYGDIASASAMRNIFKKCQLFKA